MQLSEGKVVAYSSPGHPPDAPLRIVHVHPCLIHHIQLLQGVGVLRVCDVPDVLKHLPDIYWLPGAICSSRCGDMGWRLGGGRQQVNSRTAGGWGAQKGGNAATGGAHVRGK